MLAEQKTNMGLILLGHGNNSQPVLRECELYLLPLEHSCDFFLEIIGSLVLRSWCDFLVSVFCSEAKWQVLPWDWWMQLMICTPTWCAAGSWENGASVHEGMKFIQGRKLFVNSYVTHCTDPHGHGSSDKRSRNFGECVDGSWRNGQWRILRCTSRIFQGQSIFLFLHHGVWKLMGRLITATATLASEISSRKATLTFQSQIPQLWRRHQLQSRVKCTGELLKIK